MRARIVVTKFCLRSTFSASSRSIREIRLLKNRDGRASGDAYVKFDSRDDYEHALTKDKQYIGKRYVEVRAVNGILYDTTRKTLTPCKILF